MKYARCVEICVDYFESTDRAVVQASEESGVLIVNVGKPNTRPGLISKHSK